MRKTVLRTLSAFGSSKHIQWCSCLLCVGLIGCQPQPPEQDQSPPQQSNTIELIQQDLIQPKNQNAIQKTAFTGTIRAVQQSSVQAQVMATVTRVNVQVGQNVAAGQLMIQLNNQDNAARLAQAQANLAAAQAQARQSRLMVDRKKRLYDQGFIAKTEYEQSAVDHEAQQENVRAQQASVEIALKANQDGNILSPISGVITQRTVEPGQTVAVGQTLVEIVNPNQLELKAQLPLEQSQALSVGAEIEFQLTGSTKKYQAKLTRLSPIADQASRQIEFYATPLQQLPSQSIGAFIEGNIQQPLAVSGLAIPLSAIQNMNQKASVWVVRNQKIIQQPIEILHQDHAQNQAIVKGLKIDDLVSTIRLDEKDINKTALISDH